MKLEIGLKEFEGIFFDIVMLCRVGSWGVDCLFFV